MKLGQDRLWTAFASSALRQAKQAIDQTLVIELGPLSGPSIRLLDPDRARVSDQPVDESDTPPSLKLRDLTHTAINSVRLTADDAPVLTFGCDREHFILSLDFTAAHLSEAQALDFMTGMTRAPRGPAPSSGLTLENEMEHTDLYIAGDWVESRSGDRFDVINPATEAVLASVASADLDDADQAMDAADAAFADWAARKPRERSEVLRKAWELMTARLPDFARLITLENGQGGRRRHGRSDLCGRIFPLVRRGSRSR